MDPSGSATQRQASGTAVVRKRGNPLPKPSRIDIRLPPPNTYHLKPKVLFQVKPVFNILQEKTSTVFDKIVEYDFDDFAILCKYLNIELLRAVNALYWPCYKIVVVVQCIEKADNSCRGTVRYYWNPKFDGLVTHKYEVDDYCICVSAAFFYYE
nr:tctex1 domain-containing protein 1-like [Halyomorpha halys]